jgi:hypothetical protein
MKKVTSFITLLFLTATGLFAQDQTSGSTNSSGSNRWSDTGYAKRNRATYDSLLRMHRGYWNEDSGYYIRSTGDTIRPYGRTEWMRDSINFESRNWDSTYPGRDRWGSESGMGNDQSGTSGTGNMGTGTGTQTGNTGTGTSGNQTGTTGNQSGTDTSGSQSGTGSNQSGTTGNQSGTTGSQSGTTGSQSNQSSGTTSGNMGNQSTSSNSNNQSGESTDRKTSNSSETSTSKATSSSKNMNDRVYMKGDQLMVSRNGKSTKVLKSIKLQDGTVVLANGTIQLPDGNTMQLKNGESISLNQKSKSTTNSNSSNDNQ